MLSRRRYENEQTLAARAAGVTAQPAPAQPSTIAFSDHLIALEDLRRSLQGAAPAPSDSGELDALKAEFAKAQERITELEAALEAASKAPEAPPAPEVVESEPTPEPEAPPAPEEPAAPVEAAPASEPKPGKPKRR